MPRNKVSNDIDHVPKDPQPEKAPKEPPPKPWPLPKFKPLPITRPFTHGHGLLPDTIPYDDPYAIFSLFFTESTLQTLVQHTNEYTFLYPGPEKTRVWKPTTVNEFRAFLGVSIWMGLHVESGIKDFWNTDPLKGCIHYQVLKSMSLKRWQQIDRFFHVSKPLPPGRKVTTFDKLEPLSAHLREAFKKYWKSGTHLAVDETIQRFMGRAKEIVNIPSKPTPEGFKIWVLANQGYVLDWMYHAKGRNKGDGPQDLDVYWTDRLGFTQTQAVVLDLVAQDGISKDHFHIIWLDNLFTSARLLTQLEDQGFGAAGTVRTSTTRREDLEATSGSQAQRASTEPNRGLDPRLLDLRNKWNAGIDWGKLYGCLSENKRVLELAWKDQNVVLFMTTVSNGQKKVKRLRRRPAKTATNARTSRAMFGEEARKELAIPEFIDMYNHYMNGVDNADQLRCYYSTQRVHFKSWKPLWHFLLDTTITNSYKIAYYKPERVERVQKTFRETHGHREFRIQLATQLFEHSERISGIPSTPKVSLSSRVHPAAWRDHGHVNRMGTKAKYCVPCSYAGRVIPTPGKIRKPLLEMSVNSVRPRDLDKRKRRQRPPRGIHGCKLCNIHICNHMTCWNEHLAAIPCK